MPISHDDALAAFLVHASEIADSEAENTICEWGSLLLNPHVIELFKVADGTQIIDIADTETRESFLAEELPSKMARVAELILACNAIHTSGVTNIHTLPGFERALRIAEAELTDRLISFGALAAMRRV